MNFQDRVGVVRTSGGDLVFFVNGVSQSVAASGIPPKVWAVVDLYGKCAAVTITDTGNSEQVCQAFFSCTILKYPVGSTSMYTV